MMKILRKSSRKRIAILLLAVFLIPLIPVIPVSADVGVPEFPYLSKDWYNTNTDSFALWEIHGSNKVSYVQTRTNIFPEIGPYQVVLRDGMSYLEPYTYSLDYTAITDTWTKAGNHVDGGYSWTANIRVPAPGESTVVRSDVYATLVYCTTDIMYSSSGSGRSVYAYQNFIIPDYADPTPTPEPQPEIKDWFDYPELPSNFSSDTKCILRTHSDGVNDGQLIGIAFTSGSGAFNYPNFYKSRSPYGYNSQASIENAITINTWSNDWWFSVFSVNYDESTDSYSVGGTLKSSSVNLNDGDTTWYTSRNFYWKGETVSTWSLLPSNSLVVTGDLAGTYPTGSWFEILFTNHDYVPGTSDNPNLSPTPTPTGRPSPIPQPSITPEPTVEPPDEGDDGNWTGFFGWLKKLVNAIISIPVKIVNGLLSVLKYIFIPDIGKIKALFNTLNNKFGINVPGTFEFDPVLLKNPENVVFHFKPISLNGEPTEPVDITIIDFDKVDSWLESAPGQIIIRLIQAVYMLTMWGYMIYIFRKHIATVNYTDADTLEHSKYWES